MEPTALLPLRLRSAGESGERRAIVFRSPLLRRPMAAHFRLEEPECEPKRRGEITAWPRSSALGALSLRGFA